MRTSSRHATNWSLRLAAVGLMVGMSGCATSTPDEVTNRDALFQCGSPGAIVLPIDRSPLGDRDSSEAALECLRTRIEDAKEAEIDAILLGTEGEERHFIFRSLGDSFELFGSVGDRWYYSGPCAEVDWTSGIPLPVNCEADTVDI